MAATRFILCCSDKFFLIELLSLHTFIVRSFEWNWRFFIQLSWAFTPPTHFRLLRSFENCMKGLFRFVMGHEVNVGEFLYAPIRKLPADKVWTYIVPSIKLKNDFRKLRTIFFREPRYSYCSLLASYWFKCIAVVVTEKQHVRNIFTWEMHEKLSPSKISCVLGYNAVYSGHSQPTYRRNITASNFRDEE